MTLNDAKRKKKNRLQLLPVKLNWMYNEARFNLIESEQKKNV